jgi:MYXO-CTERM domain-containing protein
MKRYIRSGILALSLSALPLGLSALAQTSGQPYQGYQDRTATTTRTEDRGSNWGWIGLIGLIGLAGLAGRRREEIPRHRPGEYRGGEPVTGAR